MPRRVWVRDGSHRQALATPTRSFPVPLNSRPLAERREIQRYRKRDVRKVGCIGSIKAVSLTRGLTQNRHNFWAKEAGFMPPAEAPDPGAKPEPVLPNPLTRRR